MGELEPPKDLGPAAADPHSSARNRLLVTTFLRTSIPFGAILGLLVGLQGNALDGLGLGILSGIGFELAMVLTVGAAPAIRREASAQETGGRARRSPRSASPACTAPGGSPCWHRSP